MTTLLTLRRPEQAFRALGVFFLSGGVLGATALVLPHWETLDVGLMLIPTFAGLLGGPLMLVLAGRLPGWMCHPLLVLGTCVVTFGIAFSGSPQASATYTLFLVWAVVFATYFFRRPAALTHLLIIGVLASAAIAVSSPDTPHGQIVIVVGVLGVTWAVASWLVDQLETTYRQLREGEQAVIARLEEAEMVKDNLLAVTSHELRTPLTSILGYVRTLQQHAAALDEANRERFLDRVAFQSERMIQLVENLLLASGVAQPTPGARADVGATAEQVTTDLAAAEHGRELEIDCPDRVQAAVSPDALRHILTNLCDNALKFAEPGTPVVVQARRSGQEVAIEVRNSGVGIDPADAERIFEPFVQVGEDESDRPDGLGLGLYVVRRLAEVHGGTVSAGGDNGNTRFTVSLPAG
jgi:signal transduction histidine kinase